jgi:hypothetical protein
MTIFIFWLMFSIACGIYASNRGRSGIGWFFIAMLISPLLGLIFVAVTKDLSKPNVAAQPGTSTHVKCPACAEFVLPEASVCKHCGTALVPTVTHAQDFQKQVKKSEKEETSNLIIGILFIAGLFGLAALINSFIP